MSTWVTSTVLKVLAEQRLGRAGCEFDAATLSGWLGGQLTEAQRVHATSRLCHLKFLTHRVAVAADRSTRLHVYTVTGDGAAAISAAAQGTVRKSGPKGTRKANPLKPDSLVMRLWLLVRLRTMVDSESAAQTLCNAGVDDFHRVQCNVRLYLRRWADAGALDEGARRINAQGTSNGNKRYVLKDEWKGASEPPAWRQILRQRARAEAGQ